MKRLSEDRKWRLLRLKRRRELRRIRDAESRPDRAWIRSDLWGRGNREEQPQPQDESVVTYAWPEASASELNFFSEKPRISCPKVFSLIENPDGTIKVFDRLVAAMRKPGVSEIHIDQTNVETTDLCASAVLGVLVKHGRGKIGLYHHHMPTDLAAADLIRAAGLGPILGIPDPKKSSNVLFYKLVERPLKAGQATGSSAKEIEGTLIVQYLDRCFRKYDAKLLEDTRQYLSNLVTEALANSEEHAGGGWWMAAYLRQGEEYGDCHLTLFNLGRTIAESMLDEAVSPRIRDGCASALQTLRRCGAFGRKYTEEAFWTIAALQPGVTSKPVNAIANRDRGTGSVKIMEAFHEIGISPRAPEPPVMVILSGNTIVRFDGTHRVEDVATGGGGTQPRIAFNVANDLRQPPDPKYVRALKERFPGTLISCRFYMDKDHLSSLKDHVESVTGPL